MGRGFLGSDAADPVALAHEARSLVRSRTGLTCCVGIGDNKARAKLATGFAKAPVGAPPEDAPGVAMLTGETWFEVMGGRPTDALWGIGPRTAAKLVDAGVRTVAELAAADEALLAQRFGPTTGPWLCRLGRGEGDKDVTDAPWVQRGRSHEETYTVDVVDRDEIEARLRLLARRVTADVVAGGRVVTHVAIKVRFAPFLTSTRVTKLRLTTTDPEVVADTAVQLLDRYEHLRPVRLLGVRVELAPPSG